ncbi:MAG: hypothetical protein AAF628_20530 [Planctomycetota bacterium]
MDDRDYDELFDELRPFARRLLRSLRGVANAPQHTQSLLHRALLKLLQAYGSELNRGEVARLLVVIMRRIHLNLLKPRPRVGPLEGAGQLVVEDPVDPPTALCGVEEIRVLSACLDQLGEHQPMLETVVVNHATGEPLRSIAVSLGLKERTAGRMLQAAQRQLRTCLAHKGYGRESDGAGPAT